VEATKPLKPPVERIAAAQHYDVLRSEHRFRAILRSMNLPED
jgi:hypothetical protein